jgi:hypothetical protein
LLWLFGTWGFSNYFTQTSLEPWFSWS